MFSEVCEDMVAEAMRLYFMLRHAGYPQEIVWSVFFNCVKNCVFSFLNKDTHVHQFSTQFLALFESEFSTTDHAPLYRRRNWVELDACSNNNAKNGKARQVTPNSLNVGLPAHEVCATPSVNRKKRKHIIYCDCCYCISSATAKCYVLTLFQGFLP